MSALHIVTELDTLFEDLVLGNAHIFDMRGDKRSYESRLETCLRLGREIPDELLPGRAIMKLSPEKRALLKDLTSEMTFRFRDAAQIGSWCSQPSAEMQFRDHMKQIEKLNKIKRR